MAVSDAVPGLSPGISRLTCHAAYAPFTPSDSEQRSGPSYYRGCWHEVSRPFLFRYYQPCRLFTVRSCSRMTGVYNPKTFILHAALHHQGCPHCELFSTAATRRCLDRVSVPVCLIVLSDQVSVVALVGRYPANKLIEREPIPQRQPCGHPLILRCHGVLIQVSLGYPPLRGMSFTCYSPVRH
jgi:hypothetical protein